MALYRAVVVSLINKITHYFMLKSHENSLMTPYLRDFGLMTPQTGIFNKILPIMVSLSRSCKISHQTRCVIVVFYQNLIHCGVIQEILQNFNETGCAILLIFSSISCLTTPKLKEI